MMRHLLRSTPARVLIVILLLVVGLVTNARSAEAQTNLVSASVNGNVITAVFSGPVVCFSGSCSGFSVTTTGGIPVSVNYALANPTNPTQILITLSDTPTAGTQVLLSYTGGNVADVNGIPIADFSNQPVQVPSGTPTVTTTGTPATATPLSATVYIQPASVIAGTGTTVTVVGSGFAPQETVTATYNAILNTGEQVIESAFGTAAVDGTVSIPNLPVPGTLAAGSYVVTVVGQVSHTQGVATFVVIPQAATPTPVPFQGTIAPPPPPPPPASPSPTPTATPTATPTSTVTPTLVPPQLGPVALHLQVKKKNVSSAKIHQIVTLAVTSTVISIPTAANDSVSWSIKYKGKQVNHHGKHIALLAGQTGTYVFDWDHKFGWAGTYSITVTNKLLGLASSKTINFKVTK